MRYEILYAYYQKKSELSCQKDYDNCTNATRLLFSKETWTKPYFYICFLLILLFSFMTEKLFFLWDRRRMVKVFFILVDGDDFCLRVFEAIQHQTKPKLFFKPLIYFCLLRKSFDGGIKVCLGMPGFFLFFFCFVLYFLALSKPSFEQSGTAQLIEMNCLI